MASTVDTGNRATSDRPVTAARYDDTDATDGYGWVLFAGSMIALVGTLNVIYGIAAIDDSRFYARDVTYVISDLNTWGWFLTVLGAIQLISAVGIWMRTPGARWVGVLTAAASAIVQMLIIRAFPLWALAIFTIDILVIYALLAHGRRLEPA
jgi:hypothetical protein